VPPLQMTSKADLIAHVRRELALRQAPRPAHRRPGRFRRTDGHRYPL